MTMKFNLIAVITLSVLASLAACGGGGGGGGGSEATAYTIGGTVTGLRKS